MTVALYITHLVRHFPLSRLVSCLLQLHVRGSSACARLRILALWPLMTVAILPIQLYVVSIEQLVVSVVVWEILIHKIQEVPGNVGCHVLVEWGVEPYNVAFAVSRFLLWHGVLHVMSVTTIFKGIFIDGFCLVESLTVI